MKKWIIGILLIYSFLSSSCAGGERPLLGNEILLIRYGVYFGECVGYCEEDLAISPGSVVYTKVSNVETDELPDIVHEIMYSEDEWSQLAENVDWRIITALPEKIGMPDEADQGGEYIEITRGETTKRLDFDYLMEVPEISSLVNDLRRLHKEMSSNLEE